MIYKATKIVAEAFEQASLKHAVRETDVFSYVDTSFTGSNCSVRIRFINSDDDNDVKVLTENFAKFPESKRIKGLELINDLNRNYKYIKFSIDDDGDLCAQYDLPVSAADENLGSIVIEIAMRCAKIVDDSYPKIMQSIWGA